jgi:hypothetical protein
MPDKSDIDPRRLDDLLAAYTDQLLGGDASESPAPSTKDRELRGLQEMVLRLWQTFGVDRPGSAMTERIYENLVAEWHETGLENRAKPFWKRPGHPGKSPRSRLPAGDRRWGYTLAMAVVVVVVLAGLVLYFVPDGGGALPGAARSEGNSALLIIALGVFFGGAAWWLIRRNR